MTNNEKVETKRSLSDLHSVVAFVGACSLVWGILGSVLLNYFRGVFDPWDSTWIATALAIPLFLLEIPFVLLQLILNPGGFVDVPVSTYVLFMLNGALWALIFVRVRYWTRKSRK